MGTDLQRLETRISAQEQETTMLHDRIETLSAGIDLSFRQLTTYQIDFEQKIEAHFNAIDSRFDAIEIRMDGMATKEDLVAL
ncbi:MAG TPA: hypothetical protein VKV37_14310, partial [Ktedonobacteraceae bacterium]|nr:hypothetical protein [Ktedonobacteraceae bacterium]